MAKLGSKERPIILKVQTEDRLREIAGICAAHDLIYIIGLEPDKPEDISDLQTALTGTVRRTIEPGRNEPCPCGSGKKYKQCHGKR